MFSANRLATTTNYHHLTALWILSGTIWQRWYQEGKTNLDLLEQEIVSGSGIAGTYVNLHLDPDRSNKTNTTMNIEMGSANI